MLGAMSSVIAALHALLDEVPVASLGVRAGEGVDVSLVPFLALRAPRRFVLLVSELSAHTAALREAGRATLMVHRDTTADDPRDHHAVERASLRCAATFLPRADADARGITAAWRERFPRVAPMILGLKDFHFVELTPEPGGAGFVQGFGRAWQISGDDLDVAEHVTGR